MLHLLRMSGCLLELRKAHCLKTHRTIHPDAFPALADMFQGCIADLPWQSLCLRCREHAMLFTAFPSYALVAEKVTLQALQGTSAKLKPGFSTGRQRPFTRIEGSPQVTVLVKSIVLVPCLCLRLDNRASCKPRDLCYS